MTEDIRRASDEQQTIQRLERRLERERRARLDAEQIGERGLRELYEGQKALRLVEAIATATNQNESLEDTLSFALDQICRFMDWSTGHVYWLDDDGERLVSAGLWFGEGHHEFRQVTLEMTFPRGVGLPGRVLASGEPLWVDDVVEDDNFPRRPSARRCGLHAAFGFPVLIGRETAAVLEFFSMEVLQPDPAVLRAMAQIGSILGRTIERKRAEERLLEKVAEAEAQRLAAEAANRAKSDFLAVTSHEVRTPLNAVLGLAQALRLEPLNHKQGELVDGVLQAGAMLLRLLNAVLDLSKIEAGKMSLDAAVFDLGRTAETVTRIWSARAAELGLTLELDMGGLPQPCGLVSDPGKIEQTLINLVSNAVKFSPPGGKIVVRLASGRPEDGRRAVTVEVIDQGPGVPAADRERIFGAFEQTELGRDVGGAGLGLSICAGHVALLGGAIRVDRAQGGGAHFTVEFSAEIDPSDPCAVDSPASYSADGADLRILAAEDNPTNRQVLKALLGAFGLNPSFVENGQQAVEAVAAEPFDLVLMDVNMPVMDGVTALQSIRRMAAPVGATPVVMVTANVFDEDVRRYLAAGADGVLKKPIDLNELFGVISQAIASARPADPAPFDSCQRQA